MKNLLKAKIGFQSGIKAGIIGSMTFTFIFAITYLLEEQISVADLPFYLIELFSFLLFAGVLGIIIGGLLGMLISLVIKSPRYAIQIGMITGMIIGSLYPILLLVLDGIQPSYLILLFIGFVAGAFAGRYGGLDFRAKWTGVNEKNQVYQI